MEMNGIIHIRIDERLIHGQIAGFWTNELKATRIMVIDDEISTDATEKSILRMAAPSGIALSVLSVEKAVANIASGKYGNQRVLVILKSPRTAVRLLEGGLSIKLINVGNMSNKEDTVAIKNSINITEQDRKDFEELIDNGVKLTAQMVPNDPVENLQSYLKK